MTTGTTVFAPRPLDDVLEEELVALHTSGLRRSLRAVQERRSGTVMSRGERIADFASNDYLGLAADSRVARAATAVLQAEGTGAGAARLISGNHPIHDTLEAELARFKQCEAALMFPSGYMVNIGVIPALMGPDDVVYSDALNHASLVDGCRLSKATLRVFAHADIDALRTMLDTDRGMFRRALIVVEGIFSMDGDLFPLGDLVTLAREFGAWTYVDDAHGTGVLGATGRGTLEHFGVGGDIDIVVGTLGKAFGTAGAFVGGTRRLIDFLTNRARSFVYTTGTPPAMAAATLEAMRIAHVEGWRRDAVRERARHLRERLRHGGRTVGGISDGYILPIRVGDPNRTMQVVADMRSRGFMIGGVRPPTVAPGTSRLRVSVSALHPPDLVDSLAANLLDALRGVPA